MRSITDDHGRAWEAVAVPTRVAHLRHGAVLGFRQAEGEAEPITAPITFNSTDAARFAIESMSEWELRRRLELAKTAHGIA
ncbi:MAG TPA: hypothetical protein VFQ45_14410 [Longimicrobium sp.]|nr:hypothetical protein [Longimicrobium sp.]